MALSYCPSCAYVRNVAFEPELLHYDTTMDTNLHHSPAFQSFSAELVKHLAERYPLRGKRRCSTSAAGRASSCASCATSRARAGVGYDAMYAGPGRSGSVRRRVPQWTRPARRDRRPFDFVTSRHWFEHIDDPYDFLVDLRAAGRRPAGARLPRGAGRLLRHGHRGLGGHLPARVVLRRLLAAPDRRARRLAGRGHRARCSRGCSGSSSSPPTCPAPPALDRAAARRRRGARQLEAIRGFAARHFAERDRWRDADRRPDRRRRPPGAVGCRLARRAVPAPSPTPTASWRRWSTSTPASGVGSCP